MPPEQLPRWDHRKGELFRKPKHGYEYALHHHHHYHHNGGGGGRWRESSSYSPFVSGSRTSSEFRRPPGHGKQGGWHLYQEDSPHGYSTPCSGDRFLDNDCFRPSGPPGNGRYGRFYRDNRNGFVQKEWRGCSLEKNQQFNGPANTQGRPPGMNDQRSVGYSPVRPSHSNSDPSTLIPSKDQTDKTSDANGSGVSQRIGKENSLESLDWKPLKCSRSGSLTSRSSGFSRSSSSKSTGESSDVKDDVAPESVTPIQSPSGDVVTCAPSSVPPEETASRKKPRLGWGEGLAKYEKKKVAGPEKDVIKIENTVSVGNVEPTHPSTSNLVDKSPKITSFSGCSSPATPSSFACSSSPGLEEKTYEKATDGDSNNFSVSSVPRSENHTEGMQFSLGKLELNSITNLSSLLNDLLQVDERFSMDSGFMRSSAFNKLLLWKGDISKSLELTETEIDLLENELNILRGDSRRSVLLCKRDISNPCSAGNGFVKSSLIVPENLFTCDDKKTTEETYCLGDDAKAIKDHSVGSVVEHPGVCDKIEYNICDIILASNKGSASKASELLTNLLPRDKIDNIVYGMDVFRLSCLPAGTKIKVKFSRRRQLLKFKERVLSLKYRAFYDLWKEDLRSLSLISHRTKPQKKLDVTSRTVQIGNQKHRASVRSRFASPAGSLSLVPSTGILNFTGKLLSDCEVKIYRSNLKMPAMILDEKDKVSSRFVSTNGLVEDPCAVEKEQALVNPWTIEEKEIFMEKLATFGKDFRKIASFLDHKTIADCIQFYYKNHKSESFDKTKKLDLKKQAKPLSSDTYMLTSEKKWGREMNSASLAVLGAASVMASQADLAMKTSKLKPRGSSHVAKDERDTVAADLLADICGSMNSCITSSVDPTDGNREWKPQKVGSSARRPLITEIVLDDYNDTCSDESCGEVDHVGWTDDEKSLFVQAISCHGKDFLMIARFVGTKTRDQCKVFFSKARKCLDLETLRPESCSGGLLGSNDTTNGGGSDIEDACVLETGSVSCSDKSGSRMDEDLPHMSQHASKPDSRSDGNCGAGQLDCKDIDMEPEVLCPGDKLADFSDPGNGGVVDDDTQRRAHPITHDVKSKARVAIDGITHEVLSSHVVPSVVDPEPVSEATCVALSDCTGPRDGQCKQRIHCGCSLANHGESEGLNGLPSDSSIEMEMNNVITLKSGPGSKLLAFQERYFRKCCHSASQNVVTEFPQSADVSSGDVKLFGKILSKPLSEFHHLRSDTKHDGP